MRFVIHFVVVVVIVIMPTPPPQAWALSDDVV